MALIKCPECGKEISNRAKACIHCGYPINSDTCNRIGGKYFEVEFEKNDFIEFLPKTHTSGITRNLYNREGIYSVRDSIISVEEKFISKIYNYQYIIDGDFIISKGNLISGYIPAGSRFNAICSEAKSYDFSFYMNGRVIQTIHYNNDLTRTGKYIRDGKLILIKFEEVTETIRIVLFVNNNQLFMGPKIKEEKFNCVYEKLLKMEHELTYSKINDTKVNRYETSNDNTMKAPWDKQYYDYPCPYCGKYKVRDAKWEDKQFSTAFWGAFSRKLHCHYKCDSCKEMWE